jgi:AraC-like DNA-binding protein
MPHESPSDRNYAVLTSSSEGGRQRVGMLSELPALLRRLDVEPADVLASVGLTPDAIDGPERQIAYSAFGRLLAESANRTHCAHLGLLAGRMWRLSDLGLLGELARHSPSVGDALQTLAVQQHLNSEGGLVYLNAGEETAELGYAIYQPGVSGVDQIYDAVIAVAFNCVRELCGPGWRPTEVIFAHARPDDPSPYRDLFRVTPRFNAEVSALRFPARWLTKPIDGADEARRRLAQQRADDAGRGQVVEQVRRTLRVLLLRGLHAGDDVAQMLSMHRRTLNRRIKAEGSTFQQLLDEVRFAVARQLLAGTDISLDDVAAMLGYSGVSPFMRAFRRWTGSTPGGWRRSLGIGQPADAPPVRREGQAFASGTGSVRSRK